MVAACVDLAVSRAAVRSRAHRNHGRTGRPCTVRATPGNAGLELNRRVGPDRSPHSPPAPHNAAILASTAEVHGPRTFNELVTLVPRRSTVPSAYGNPAERGGMLPIFSSVSTSGDDLKHPGPPVRGS